MRLSQHLLAHTNGRLGLIFSQQTVEVIVGYWPLVANVVTKPELSATAQTVKLDASGSSRAVQNADIKTIKLDANGYTIELDTDIER